MTKRVLAATDLSEASDEALRQAHAYARSSGAELAVCHTLPDLLGINALFPPRTPVVLRQVGELIDRLRDLVAQRVATCMPGAKVEIFVEQGAAYAGILRRAEAWSADLVVVGSYGRSGLPRLHLGSVAEQVARHAHCSVLIARSTSNRGVVLAATDFSDPSLPAIVAGAEEARRRGAALVVMHAIDFASLAVTLEEMFLSATEDPENWRLDQQLRDTVAGKLRDALEKCGVSGEVRVAQGSPAAAIARSVDELGAELLVVGTRGRTGLARLALGSVAERVIRSAICPVLAVRLADKATAQR